MSVRVEVDGDHIRVVGPNVEMTPELRRALAAAKRILLIFPGKVTWEPDRKSVV